LKQRSLSVVTLDLLSVGARAFEEEGPNLKAGGPKFLLILALEKNAVHNELQT